MRAEVSHELPRQDSHSAQHLELRATLPPARESLEWGGTLEHERAHLLCQWQASLIDHGTLLTQAGCRFRPPSPRAPVGHSQLDMRSNSVASPAHELLLSSHWVGMEMVTFRPWAIKDHLGVCFTFHMLGQGTRGNILVLRGVLGASSPEAPDPQGSLLRAGGRGYTSCVLQHPSPNSCPFFGMTSRSLSPAAWL